MFVVAKHVKTGTRWREQDRITRTRECRTPEDSVGHRIRSAHRDAVVDGSCDRVGGFSDEYGCPTLACESLDEGRVRPPLVAAASDEDSARLRESFERAHSSPDVGALGVVVEADPTHFGDESGAMGKITEFFQHSADRRGSHFEWCNRSDRRCYVERIVPPRQRHFPSGKSIAGPMIHDFVGRNIDDPARPKGCDLGSATLRLTETRWVAKGNDCTILLGLSGKGVALGVRVMLEADVSVEVVLRNVEEGTYVRAERVNALHLETGYLEDNDVKWCICTPRKRLSQIPADECAHSAGCQHRPDKRRRRAFAVSSPDRDNRRRVAHGAGSQLHFTPNAHSLPFRGHNLRQRGDSRRNDNQVSLPNGRSVGASFDSHAKPLKSINIEEAIRIIK